MLCKLLGFGTLYLIWRAWHHADMGEVLIYGLGAVLCFCAMAIAYSFAYDKKHNMTASRDASILILLYSIIFHGTTIVFFLIAAGIAAYQVFLK